MAIEPSSSKLVNLPRNPIPQTDHIDFLIRSLAREAHNGIRGAQTYHRIINRAHDVCEYINHLIEDTRIKRDWKIYKLYTAQIGGLTELLFQITKIIKKETEVYLPLQPKSVEECLAHIECWQGNRDICRDVLTELYAQPFEISQSPPDDGIIVAAHLDDIAWFSDVCKAISMIPNTLSPDIQQISGHIRAAITEIQETIDQSSSIEERRMVLCTRCFMVMHGVIAIAADPNTTRNLRKHLRSQITWMKALSLIERIHTELRIPSDRIYHLKRDWDTYEEYLLTLKPETKGVDELLNQLNPYIPSVQQLYLGHCQALVTSCSAIGQHIKFVDCEDGIERLESAIEKVIKAMELSATVTVHIDIFNLNGNRQNPAWVAIDEAIAEIRAIYSDFQMSPQDVNNSARNDQNVGKIRSPERGYGDLENQLIVSPLSPDALQTPSQIADSDCLSPNDKTVSSSGKYDTSHSNKSSDTATCVGTDSGTLTVYSNSGHLRYSEGQTRKERSKYGRPLSVASYASSSPYEVTDLTGCWKRFTKKPSATGGNSDIYKSWLVSGIHPYPEQLIAVKLLRSIRIEPGSEAADILHKRLLRELHVWSQLNHKNIVPFLGYAFDGESPCLIAPWYEKGSVPQYLRSYPRVNRSQLVLECMDGLVYLHSRDPPVVHGDIKAANVLVDDGGHARITDFGLSRVLQDGPTGYTTSHGIAGTHRWMAPELFNQENPRATTASDVYALVLLALEIYTGKIPFQNLQDLSFLMAMIKGQSPERSHYLPFNIPDKIWQIFERGWSSDPKKRPRVDDLRTMFIDTLKEATER